MNMMIRRRQHYRRRYSASEQAMLDMLPLDGSRITTADMAARVYRGQHDLPMDLQNNLTTKLRRLIQKVDHNREDFIIKKSKQLGPYPQEVWVEKRHGVRTKTS